jgi:CDP-paratose 2-epimerase
MRVLITGICGFVGSRIALELQRLVSGIAITGIDNLSRAGSELNRAALRGRGIDVRHGDIRLRSDFDTLPRVDWVIDAAANPRVMAGIDGQSSPRQVIENNLQGTVEILEYCRAHGAGLVLLSTSRVYSIAALVAAPLKVERSAFTIDTSQSMPAGLSGRGVAEGFSTSPPVSLYGATKLASEVLALEYAETLGLPVWINRCGILAGAGQFGVADQGILAYWINAHLRRRPLRYTGFDGSGVQSRDALHPRDLTALVLQQMRSGRSKGNRLYVASGGVDRVFSLAQLTAWCDARFGAHGVERDATPRPLDIPWFAGDSTMARSDFGWTPQVALDAILDEIAEHAQANPNWMTISGAA